MRDFFYAESVSHEFTNYKLFLIREFVASTFFKLIHLQ